ncbi:hypothetical protein TARUN_9941 [Trichoderma arundinaceum]|uniref:Uncharacterized protein n=1 Tax=Trichoderma arundinaceum TaxID=490622 RepID=A0A395N8I2_TRIAR|nr:hypothetical protein TARUN_9941 [Trichoderma arundinaceum]
MADPGHLSPTSADKLGSRPAAGLPVFLLKALLVWLRRDTSIRSYIAGHQRFCFPRDEIPAAAHEMQALSTTLRIWPRRTTTGRLTVCWYYYWSYGDPNGLGVRPRNVSRIVS